MKPIDNDDDDDVDRHTSHVTPHVQLVEGSDDGD